ncbi:MAG: DHH family phosphoesterase [Clostridiales bacterium]|nr:DHH family phosphoesterase [Clostridiales bacterium]
MTKLEELASLLKGKKVVIQTHDFPDPDAIGAAFGLQYLLSTKGIETKIVHFGNFDKRTLRLTTDLFHITTINAAFYEGSEDDFVINIDGQKNNANFSDLIGNEIACIDHHQWVSDYKYAFVDHRIVGACSSIIALYFKENNIAVPTDVASALLYGIKIDTLNFTKGVTDTDISAFGILNPEADQSLLLRLDSNELGLDDLRAYGAAIQNLHAKDGIGFVHIPFDCPDRLVAMVSNFILSLDCVVLSVVYADRDGGMKFSIRSENSDLNAGDLIRVALEGIGDGGGHPMIAGGVIFPDGMEKLGNDTDTAIRQLFFDTYEKMKAKSSSTPA